MIDFHFKFTYRQLHCALIQLGFQRQDDNPAAQGDVFFEGRSDSLIVLPKHAPESDVEPFDLLRVRNAVVYRGLVTDEQFHQLLSN